MTSSRRHLAFAGLLAFIVLGAAGASAQTVPAAPTTTPMPPAAEAAAGAVPNSSARPRMDRADRADRAARYERWQAHRAQRMAALKQKLRLDASQESAWARFESAQRPPERKVDAPRQERDELAKLTTPQRLERMQARQAERSARFARRADATRSFYAALTQEQQKTFDAETLRAGPRGHGQGHRHPGEPAKG